MAGKTKKKSAKQPLDTRSKMYIVLGICSLMLLVTVAISFVLVGGLDLFASAEAESNAASDSESLVTESGYDKDQNTIDKDAYSSTILEKSDDAGQSYVDETLFLGDSNTARMYRMFDYCSYDNAIGSVGMSARSLESFACVQLKGYSGYKTMPEAVALMQPRRVILTFGTNDLSPTNTADNFIESYQAGIEAIAEAYPSVDIIINAIPPLGQKHSNESLTQQQVDEFNKALVEMCQKKGWKFLNSAEVLKDSATGYAKSGYVESSDGIHLTRDAMEALFEYVRTHSYITEDDRPTVKNVAVHTGEKDVVTFTTPVVTTTAAPDSTASSESETSSSSTAAEPTPVPTQAPTQVPTQAPAPVPATPEPTPVPATPEPTPVPATPEPTPVPATPSPTPETTVPGNTPPTSPEGNESNPGGGTLSQQDQTNPEAA
ncbi:GDSL-type esterase/lipase family protein [uncultured Subdoligranulum sp.]|uniref:SGNH/GDSL hydrolase family protein n=1 Tax=uncultured Subdoligranulum sp. TaxID=512298 RepID=UPI00261AE8F9|nr:GDSL-type esterase/lipase family protein [uncultured Subdoligranulum sp.]